MEIFMFMTYFVVGLIIISLISIISCSFCQRSSKEPPSKETSSELTTTDQNRQKSVHTGNTSKTCVTVDVFELGEKSSILISHGGESIQKKSFNVSLKSAKGSTKSPQQLAISKNSKGSLAKKSITKDTPKSGKGSSRNKSVTKGGGSTKSAKGTSSKGLGKSGKESKKMTTPMKRGDPGLTAPIRPN